MFALAYRRNDKDVHSECSENRITTETMKQYFDFIPHMTDTPISFTIESGQLMGFICAQLDAKNIPYDVQVHNRRIDDGGPVEGTDFIMPPMESFDYAIITAPLSQTMINRLIADDDMDTFDNDATMMDAYVNWHRDENEKDMEWD